MGDSDKPGSLQRYRGKRDPGRTNEPFSAEPMASGEARPGTWSGAFVVHEHDASRHHYDLRIEMAGVLRSFAVPNGPTLDPKEKRLAVETEDHPLMYLDFEGVIPDGNYGAGPMIAWDTGRVRYLENDAETGVAKGKLDFELSGYKLRGRFALVLTSGRKGEVVKQRQWLLLKKTDAHARPGTEITKDAPESVLSGLTAAELETAAERARQVEERARELGAKKKPLDARSVVPMAATLSDQSELDAADMLYELKLDGVRIVAEKRGDEVQLFYRKGRSATASYPDIVRALRALPFERLVLDGEIVAFDVNGRPDFQRLAQRFSATRARDVQRAMLAVPVSYVVFDALAIGEHDLTSLPLVERKQLLAQMVPARGMIRLLDHVEGSGRAMYDFCNAQKLEGVIAKRLRSTYRMGPRRSSEWLKIKCEREADFVVVGYTKGDGRDIGALDLASYVGDQLVSRGKVGSGLDQSTMDLLLPELQKRRVQKTSVHGTMQPAPRGRTFVRPELVVNVRYMGFTDEGSLRHPVFRGLRHDVAPRDCTTGPNESVDELIAHTPDPATDDAEAPEPAQPRAVAKAVAKKPGERKVKLTNPDKVFWPVEGYKKRDLWSYYEQIGPTLLPFLKERPVILVRYPDGIEGKSFYQWNAPQGTPSWVRTVRVKWDDRDGKEAELFLIDDVDTLLHIANLGCIPLHILAARMGTLSTCDFLTIDFDLNGQPLAHGITLARELQKVLGELQLRSYPKTSGQTGIHVLVPLGPAVSFDTAVALCDLLGTIVVARHRDIATMERTKSKRGPRVYVDTGQTGTIRAIVSPYSVRAYPGGRVSTPLLWDEVGFALDPSRYTMLTVPDRVADMGDPMRDFLEQAPDIAAVVQALAKMLPDRR
jgi:bifunctional non-homologous end joining protein LigD